MKGNFKCKYWVLFSLTGLQSGFILDNMISPLLFRKVLDNFKAAVIIHRYKWGVLQVL